MLYVAGKKGAFCRSVIGVNCLSRPFAWNRIIAVLVRESSSIFVRVSNSPLREVCGRMEQNTQLVQFHEVLGVRPPFASSFKQGKGRQGITVRNLLKSK